MITSIMRRPLGRLIRLVAIATTAVALQACATSQSSIVRNDQRTSDTQFDGTWKISIADAARLQPLPGNYEINCRGSAFDIIAVVKSGVMTLSSDLVSGRTNVNDAGRFRAEWALNGEAGTTGSSNETLSKAKQKYILQGSLSNKKSGGRFTLGVEQFGYQGCKQAVTLTRLGA